MKAKVLRTFIDEKTIRVKDKVIDIERERFEEINSTSSVLLLEEVQSNKELEYPKHTGGGWYELSNGEKVQGKEEAEELEDKLRG